MRISPLLAAVLLSAVPAAWGQISVDVDVEQDQFLRDEGLPVQVRVTNRSGQALPLGREDDWLAFAVESLDGAVVTKLGPVPVTGEFSLASGSVAKQQVDLVPCYDLSQPGRYQVTATVRIKEWDKEFVSRPHPFEVVRGTKLWEQEFGVPTPGGAPETRKYILQQANYRKRLKLYVRVADSSDQRVFRVFPCGPLVSFNQPEAQVDKSGYLHVLFQTGAHTFLFCVVGPEGELVLRHTYDYTATRPTLRPNEEGRIFVSGGARHPTSADIPPSLTSAAPQPGGPAPGAAPTNVPAEPPKNDQAPKKK